MVVFKEVGFLSRLVLVVAAHGDLEESCHKSFRLIFECFDDY